MPWVQLTTRRWYVRDGSAPLGRQVGVLPFPFRSYCWGPLWQELRRRLPEDTAFRPGVRVAAVSHTEDGAALHLDGIDGIEDGDSDESGEGNNRGGEGSGERQRTGAGRCTERFDLVIGADGYRSVVRDTAFPGVRPGCSRLSRLARRRPCRPADGARPPRPRRPIPGRRRTVSTASSPAAMSSSTAFRTAAGAARELGPVHRPAHAASTWASTPPPACHPAPSPTPCTPISRTSRTSCCRPTGAG